MGVRLAFHLEFYLIYVECKSVLCFHIPLVKQKETLFYLWLVPKQ